MGSIRNFLSLVLLPLHPRGTCHKLTASIRVVWAEHNRTGFNGPKIL